jgi:TonB-linked SusC/RagA family outer membrane protein
MKTILLILVLWLLPVTLALAVGQEGRFTFDFRDRPITEVLSAVESGSGYVFLFPGPVEEALRERVSLRVEAVTIDELLARLFLSTDLVYKIVDRQVLIARNAPPEVSRQDSVRAMVEGVVIDADGLPLAGATVRVKDRPGGTATDREGRFSLPVAGGEGVLVVSFVGMETQEVVVKRGVTRYEITLVDSKTELEEVVAFGYFHRRRDNFTGSAVTVSGEELKRVSSNSLVRAIEAFDPSFKVLQDNLAGSDPNKMPNIHVRGASSVPTGAGGEVLRRDNINSAVNLPTFILDGYEVGVEKIYDLDMNRVASVSLLKDAAATAIYGSRAANGVLVVTTVAPGEGKLRVSYHYELSPSFPDLSSYDVLNAAEKLEYERRAGVYETEGISLDEQEELYYRKLYNVVSGVDTYWLAWPVKNAFGHKHSLFIEGGSPVVRYGISGQYQSMPGVMRHSSRDRLGLDVELSYDMERVILFKNVLSVSRVKGADSPYGNFSEYVRMNPYYPKDDERGRVVREVDTWRDRGGTGGGIRENVVLNPLYNATLGSFSESGYLEISELFSAEWNIVPGLRLRGLIGFVQKNTTNDQFVSPDANEFYFYSFDELSKRGRYTYSDAKEWHVDGSATLTWSRDVGDHFFHLALGANIRSGESRGKSFTAIGFTNDRFSDIGYAGGYAEGDSPVSSVDKERLVGIFGSVNYSYRNRYLLDISMRADGSSKFGADNRMAPFWATGLGWNVHGEEFMKQIHAISLLRLKVNAGMTGSVSFSPYMANTLYRYEKSNWYSTGVGAVVTQFGNSSLKWQRTMNYDVGADIGLLNDRFYLSGRYYYKLTRDMLTDVTLPPSTGFTYYRENLGDILNKGYEVGVKWNVFKRNDLSISLTGNFVHNTNTLMKISNALNKMNERADEEQQEMGVPLVRYHENASMNTIYAVPSRGIDPENGQEIFVKRDGSLTHAWDVKDVVAIRDATPDLDGNFGGSFYYKGFILSLSFYTRFGGYEYNQTLVDKVENADPRYNLDRRAWENRWVNPGDKALYKNIRDHGNTRVTERFVQKDNLVELRSLYLSYDVDMALLRRAGLRSLRASVTANDLWRTSSIALERGINYPFARGFTLSIQTTF